MSGKLLDGATNFMKNFVKKVDDSVLKRRNQANITFTSVQFSGCGQKTKSYKPGMGYVKDSEIGKEVKRKITKFFYYFLFRKSILPDGLEWLLKEFIIGDLIPHLLQGEIIKIFNSYKLYKL